MRYAQTVVMATDATKARATVISAHLENGVPYAVRTVTMNIVLTSDATNPMGHANHVLHHFGDQLVIFLATMKIVQRVIKQQDNVKNVNRENGANTVNTRVMQTTARDINATKLQETAYLA